MCFIQVTSTITRMRNYTNEIKSFPLLRTIRLYQHIKTEYTLILEQFTQLFIKQYRIDSGHN